MLLAGWHHEWAPGNHTLFLAGRLADHFEVMNPEQQISLLVKTNLSNPASQVLPLWLEQAYDSDATIYTAEAQQIFQRDRQTWIGGVRYQKGRFEAKNQYGPVTFPTNINPMLVNIYNLSGQVDQLSRQAVSSDFERISAYAYGQWQVADPLLLVAGLSYDRIEFPQDFRFAPLWTSDEETKEQVSPKAGLIWTPSGNTTVRAAYAQSLGGVSFDQSFQLEPSQVAGFNQAWRSIIPEAVAGANAAPKFETWGLSLEQRVGRGTFLGLSGEWLHSEVGRKLGAFDLLATSFTISPSQMREHLDFDERTLVFTFNQLVGNHWSFGARYRLSQAELNYQLTDVPASAMFPAGGQRDYDWEAVLHQVHLAAHYYHPCGFFGSFETLWNHQSNHGYSGTRPGDDFWQFNLFAGYRFPRRQAELQLGLLNLTDQNYRLNPLNLTAYLPRSRTLAVSFKFSF